ncbi:MAG TPA: hypothetical protein VHB98_10495 [Chloroflexota bacterium]|nr:hypothetical protein [Chloroflexota bacterium]
MYPDGFFRLGEEEPPTGDALAVETGYIDGYRIVYQQLPTNWFAFSPDVDLVFVAGTSRGDVEERMRKALSLHLADQKKMGTRSHG